MWTNHDYSRFQDAEKYIPWRVASLNFTGLFNILNSSTNRLNTTTYKHNLQYLKDFYAWFLKWRNHNVAKTKSSLPPNSSLYDSMTGFFSKESSDDLLSMLQSLIQLTEFYADGVKNQDGTDFYLLACRFTQDRLENEFSAIKLRSKHARLDHQITDASSKAVSIRREVVMCSKRVAKKRNSIVQGENDKEIINKDYFNIEFAEGIKSDASNIMQKKYSEIREWSFNVDGFKSFIIQK